MKNSREVSPAPIALFAYKRIDALVKTIAALQRNEMASQSVLHVFVDGPKNLSDGPKVDQVKRIVDQISGFKHIERCYSPVNRGLANSIITGVSQLLATHPSVIVLEDDLITAPNFLSYMNACLQTYRDTPRAFSVSGYSFPFVKPINYPHDVYFFPRYSSWGWATWANRWQLADWQMQDYADFLRDRKAQETFSAGGSDLMRMLRRQMNGELDSWAIRWGYHQAKQNGYTVYPVNSKVDNIGFDGDATHTNVFNRYKTSLTVQESGLLQLPVSVVEDPYYSIRFRRKYSLETRLYNRLKTYAGLR